MRKFLIRARTRLLFFGLMVVFLFMVAGNISLAVNRQVLQEKASRYFSNPFSVGSAYYIFPNRIYFNHIEVQQPVAFSKQSTFVVSHAAIRFSLWKFLIQGKVHISDVVVYPSQLNYYALSKFFEINAEKLLEAIRNAPGYDIKVRVKEALLDFEREGGGGLDYVMVGFLVMIRDGNLQGKGFFRADQYRMVQGKVDKSQRLALGQPLWYGISGQIQPNGLQLDQLIFNSRRFYAKLWASFLSGVIKINGFIFAYTGKIDDEDKPRPRVPDRHLSDFPGDKPLTDVNCYILDIDGQMTVAFPDVHIDKFNFTFNNLPVALSGDVSFLDFVTFRSLGTIGSRLSSPGKGSFFETAEISVNGIWKTGVVISNWEGDIHSFDREGIYFSPEKVHVNLKNLFSYFDDQRRLNIRLIRGDVSYQTNDKAHAILFEDLQSYIVQDEEGIHLQDINARFYRGGIRGQLSMGGADPYRISSRFEVKDADTRMLETVLVHFAKFNGKFSSTMDFMNSPSPELKGEINILDGRLTDLDFFDWVGDSFKLPSLKAVDFSKASAHFSVNKDFAQLTDIRLDSKDVRISGYFNVGSSNLVASKLTLALSKDLLSHSPKFKPILKIFDGEDPDLEFDFQLSGDLDSMNFLWLPSEAKRKIQTQIPDFIERKIEQNIDGIMRE